MNPAQCRGEFLRHHFKRRGQRRSSSDKHIIMTGTQPVGGRQAHQFAQTTPHAVALDGVADLPRHGKAYARRACLIAPPRLQHKGCSGRSCTTRRSLEIAAASEPLNGNGGMRLPIRH